MLERGHQQNPAPENKGAGWLAETLHHERCHLALENLNHCIHAWMMLVVGLGLSHCMLEVPASELMDSLY